MLGNYLRTVDHYNPLKNPIISKTPRIVYEFDTASLIEPTCTPPRPPPRPRR
jgi:hypothetical protein